MANEPPAAGKESEPPEAGKASPGSAAEREIALAELVSRVLDRGVLLEGELIISVADIDLVYLKLKALLTSVENMPEDAMRGTMLEPPDRE